MNVQHIMDGLIGNDRSLEWILQFLPILGASFVTSLIATRLCRRLALRYHFVDKPDQSVKTHKKPIAYLGGVGIFIGLIVGVLWGMILLSLQKAPGETFTSLRAICFGAAIACLVGLTDDLSGLKPGQKMIGQVLAASVLLFAGIWPNLNWLRDPLGLSLSTGVLRGLSILLVYLFVLGATNSLNLLDGLDGLCAGVTVIITLALLGLSIHLATWGFSESQDPVRIVVCLALVGGVLGFLPFNRHPARIFMGDAGSMLLGFVIASLMILCAERVPRWWLASMVVFGLPILDTAVALIRRLINQRPLFESDRGHIYDQMMDRGWSLKKTVTVCYVLAALYAIIGLIMSQIRTRYAAVAYVLIIIVSSLIIWRKGFLKMRGLRGAIQKEESSPKPLHLSIENPGDSV